MRKVLCALILVMTSIQCFAQSVKLNLQSHDDLVIVSIENLSSSDVRVSKSFTQNPAFGLIEMDLTIDGRRFIFETPPNENLASESDYITLQPYDVSGHVFLISDLRRMYGVKSYCFSLAVTYHDVMAKKFSAFSKTIKSKKIQVCQRDKNQGSENTFTTEELKKKRDGGN